MAKFTNNIFYHVNISHLFHNLLNFSDAKVKKYILRYTHSNIPRNKRKIAIQKKPTQYLYILCVSHWSENTQFTQRNPGTDMIFTFRILGFFCFELGLMIYIRRKVTTSSWYEPFEQRGEQIRHFGVIRRKRKVLVEDNEQCSATSATIVRTT